jgi:hypothetical protein
VVPNGLINRVRRFFILAAAHFRVLALACA